MFEKFYGMKVLDVSAYGVDEFDFTCNLLGFGASIGETGYALLQFQNGNLYFSTDGITTEKPHRDGVHALVVGNFCRDIVGKTLLAIQNEVDQPKTTFTLTFRDCKPIVCYFSEEKGFCDRNYYSIDIFDVD